MRPAIDCFVRERNSQPEGGSGLRADVSDGERPGGHRRSDVPALTAQMRTDFPAIVHGQSCASTSPCTILLPVRSYPPGRTVYGSSGALDVKELALYAQDAITKGNWALNLGLRGDFYNGLTTHREAEPRLGSRLQHQEARTPCFVFPTHELLETPFNENLVLASIGCSNPVLNPLLGCARRRSDPVQSGMAQ